MAPFLLIIISYYITGGSGTCAGVVAANVAANLVNNANENNNNNNNNNNQDNTNNNNMNVGNSANMNTNMNMLLPGKRSISTGDLIPASALRTMTGLALGSAALYTGDMWKHLRNTFPPRQAVDRLFCTTLASPSQVSDVSGVLLKINKIALGLLTSDMFQNILSFQQALDYSLGEGTCQ